MTDVDYTKWELDFAEKDHTLGSNLHYVGVITGFSECEILEMCFDMGIKRKTLLDESWGGQTFIEVFKALGFNCAHRWHKPNLDSPKPMLLRMRSPIHKSGWFLYIYHNGRVYSGLQGGYWVDKRDEFFRHFNGKYWTRREYFIGKESKPLGCLLLTSALEIYL